MPRSSGWRPSLRYSRGTRGGPSIRSEQERSGHSSAATPQRAFRSGHSAAGTPQRAFRSGHSAAGIPQRAFRSGHSAAVEAGMGQGRGVGIKGGG